jgi:hypothetical protein
MLPDVKIQVIKDKSFDKTSDYSWINIKVNKRKIGKARIYSLRKSLRIHSFMIFPEFERNGYAQRIIDLFKEQYEVIVAERVRNTARRFWEKMDFVGDNSGNYIWKSRG